MRQFRKLGDARVSNTEVHAKGRGDGGGERVGGTVERTTYGLLSR